MHAAVLARNGPFADETFILPPRPPVDAGDPSQPPAYRGYSSSGASSFSMSPLLTYSLAQHSRHHCQGSPARRQAGATPWQAPCRSRCRPHLATVSSSPWRRAQASQVVLMTTVGPRRTNARGDDRPLKDPAGRRKDREDPRREGRQTSDHRRCRPFGTSAGPIAGATWRATTPAPKGDHGRKPARACPRPTSRCGRGPGATSPAEPGGR